MLKKELVIIGGGPAGLTAGLYAARGLMDAVLIEGGLPGSQAATTESIENFPGFPEGIGGPELVQKIENQARRFGLEILSGSVRSVRESGKDFIVETEKASFQARSVIVATGAAPRMLGAKGESDLRGRGVSYCATCDGALFGDAAVAVVGGGDAAVEEAIYLTRFASRVYLIHRRDTLRAAAVIARRAAENPKINFIFNTVVTEIQGEDLVERIALKDVVSGEEKRVPVDGVFIYVGTRPNSDFVKGLVETDDRGFIITDREMATSVPGIFAAGDVCRKSLRQVVTAVADGAIAIFSAEKYLEL
ncbi:MAG: thioredoxin-disulfide reductase [Eubacteriales bacterium]